MAAKRGSYSSTKQQERRERVLSMARELIAQKGYDGLTMRDLASASGVSDATLYNLFVSKDRLVMAAVSDLFDQIAAGVQVGSQTQGLAAILAYSESIIEQILQNPAYARAMTKALFLADPGSPIVEVLLDSNRRYFSKELCTARREGELEEGVDLTVSTAILSGHTWGVLLLWDKGLVNLENLSAVCLRSVEISTLAIASKKGRRVLRARCRPPAK